MKPFYYTPQQSCYQAILQQQLNNGVCIAQAIADAKRAAKKMPKK